MKETDYRRLIEDIFDNLISIKYLNGFYSFGYIINLIKLVGVLEYLYCNSFSKERETIDNVYMSIYEEKFNQGEISKPYDERDVEFYLSSICSCERQVNILLDICKNSRITIKLICENYKIYINNDKRMEALSNAYTDCIDTPVYCMEMFGYDIYKIFTSIGYVYYGKYTSIESAMATIREMRSTIIVLSHNKVFSDTLDREPEKVRAICDSGYDFLCNIGLIDRKLAEDERLELLPQNLIDFKFIIELLADRAKVLDVELLNAIIYEYSEDLKLAIYNLKYIKENTNTNIVSTESRIVNFYSHCIKWMLANENDQYISASSWVNTIIDASDVIRDTITKDANNSVIDVNFASKFNNKIYDKFLLAVKRAIKDCKDGKIEIDITKESATPVFETFFSVERIANGVNLVRPWLAMYAKSDKALTVLYGKVHTRAKIDEDIAKMKKLMELDKRNKK